MEIVVGVMFEICEVCLIELGLWLFNLVIILFDKLDIWW